MKIRKCINYVRVRSLRRYFGLQSRAGYTAVCIQIYPARECKPE